MNYVYAFTHLDKGACVLSGLKNVDADYELLRGVSRKDSFPTDASFDMDDDFGVKLQDVLKNGKMLLVISEPLKALLEKERLKNNELLPVVIHDKKGRPIKRPYFILHQIVLQDCIDLSATVAEKNPINPELFIDVERITIDEKRIDPEVALFRPKHHPTMLILKRDLSDRIAASGVTGIGFGEIDQYDQFETL